MPAGRFLVAGGLTAGADLALPDEIAHQARDVLRLRVGDALQLLDGVGGEYAATVLSMGRRETLVRVGERANGLPEPLARVTLCLGLIKAARFEWALQKGTELGVSVIQPLITERSVASAEEFGPAKRARYERIIAEAMEQCGGAWLPRLAAPRPLLECLREAPADVIALIPWEEQADGPLRATLAHALAERMSAGATTEAPSIWLFIGSEGGFSAAEVNAARAAGALPVTLGARVLRAETAAIAAVILALDAIGALEQGPPR